MTNSTHGHAPLANSIDVSNRRIAALRANGEDKIGHSGSPAWRDAMHEAPEGKPGASDKADDPSVTARRVAWFSCGAASAVAAKLVADQYGDDSAVVYCDTMSTEHPDNARFFADVERWIDRPITRIRSTRYASIDEVFEKRRYLAGVKGALCTTEMKKFPREAWQRPDDVHVFGYTADEASRADDFEDRNPSLRVEWVLIDRGIDKAECLRIVARAGIALPAMYGLGFEHNNCLGCPKATSPGYWNRVRRLFPEVFDRRCRQSRLIGAKLVRIRGVRKFLDELPIDADAPDDAIECGPACQMEMPL